MVNEIKEIAEKKFADLKVGLNSGTSQKIEIPDLTAPGEPLELGALHPISTTLNRIVEIFERIGVYDC